jgi:hypothetical protein
LKKSAVSVRFRFYKQKTEKTEPNRTQTVKKPEKNQARPEKPSHNRAKPKNLAKTKPNRFEPVFAQKTDLTETGRFDPVSVFSKKKSV